MVSRLLNDIKLLLLLSPSIKVGNIKSLLAKFINFAIFVSVDWLSTGGSLKINESNSKLGDLLLISCSQPSFAFPYEQTGSNEEDSE
ncbi:uncharacterized protein METZ01_LOCUS281630 [marine metagenome]|uniref:Uncharacterized protein n=1 Tax=marine metagenome TaxID=408172 RepID=A0A382KWI0_9ZZZZ